jgi:hypothetical protein
VSRQASKGAIDVLYKGAIDAFSEVVKADQHMVGDGLDGCIRAAVNI